MEKKTERITVRMTPEFYNRLHKEAEYQDRKPAWLANDFIERALKRKPKRR